MTLSSRQKKGPGSNRENKTVMGAVAWITLEFYTRGKNIALLPVIYKALVRLSWFEWGWKEKGDTMGTKGCCYATWWWDLLRVMQEQNTFLLHFYVVLVPRTLIWAHVARNVRKSYQERNIHLNVKSKWPGFTRSSSFWAIETQVPSQVKLETSHQHFRMHGENNQGHQQVWRRIGHDRQLLLSAMSSRSIQVTGDQRRIITFQRRVTK